jgi:hypothetical protein
LVEQAVKFKRGNYRLVFSLFCVVFFNISSYACKCSDDIDKSQEFTFRNYVTYDYIIAIRLDSVVTKEFNWRADKLNSNAIVDYQSHTLTFFSIVDTFKRKGRINVNLLLFDMTVANQKVLNRDTLLIYFRADQMEKLSPEHDDMIMRVDCCTRLRTSSNSSNGCNWYDWFIEEKKWTPQIYENYAKQAFYQEYEMLKTLTTQKDGQIVFHYLDGQVSLKGKIQKGLPIGKWCAYYPNMKLFGNGHLWLKVCFKKGVQRGKRHFWRILQFGLLDKKAAFQHVME